MKLPFIVAFTSMIIATLLFTGMAAANDVIVVDEAAGPGSDYSTISAAVFFANDGDIILIRPGNYGNANINNKSLTLIGDGAVRPVLASINVAILDANKQVALRGLACTENAGFANQLLHILDCAGAVLVEDCIFEVEVSGQPNTTGIRIVDSDKVSVTRCLVKGANGYTIFLGPGVKGGPGLEIYNSNVYLYGTSVDGGKGADAELNTLLKLVWGSSPGGPGVMFNGGFLFIAGCDISGGPGGDGLEFSGTGYQSSDGGDGVELNGMAVTLDSMVMGGLAGVDPPGYPQVGLDGVAFDIHGGSVQTIAESYRSCEMEAPVKNLDQLTLTVTGVPGEFAWLLLSDSPGINYYPEYRGALAPGFPLNLIFLGALPPSGTLQLTSTVNLGFPAGVEGYLFYGQMIVPGQPSGGVLSSPSVAVIVDN